MKKIILVSLFILLGRCVLYSRGLSDTSTVEKTGWLVYYLGHGIWFESDITKNVKDRFFFTARENYQNGLIVDYSGDANSFKSIAKCYSVKVLLQTDSVTKKAEYISEESFCIIPVKVKVKIQPDADQFDFAGVSFKRNKSKATIEYWFHTNYRVVEVELLRKKDRKKIKQIKYNK